MKNIRKIGTLLLIAVMVLGVLLISGCGSSEQTDTAQPQEQAAETLLVYSGAGLSAAMDEIAQVYKEQTGVVIEYSYGGSAQNLSQIELSGKGDVWTPGSMTDCDIAEEKGLIENKQNVAYHVPVIIVPEGNPAGITGLNDLANPGVKIALGDEESCAIGKVCPKILNAAGIYEAVSQNVVTRTATVSELPTYVQMKQVDASIVWEDNALNTDGVEIIQIPDDVNQIKTIPVAVLKITEKLESAQQFADFVASDEGKAIFEKHGFKPCE